MRTVTSTPASEASFLIAASRSFPKGSESYSYDRREIFHSCRRRKSALLHVFKEMWNNVFDTEDFVTLNSLGKTSVGWPRITNSRELSLRRLESKSSRLCSKNLEDTGSKNTLCLSGLCHVASTACRLIGPRMPAPDVYRHHFCLLSR